MATKSLIFLAVLAAALGLAAALPTLECKEGNLYGTEKLVEVVEKTIDDCKNSTESKADLFTCVFKGLNMFDDDKPAMDKIKGFFNDIFSSKLVSGATDLMSNVMTCGETYAKSFQVQDMESLGKAGEDFSQCFMTAVRKYQDLLKNKCATDKKL